MDKVTKECVWCHKEFETEKRFANITYRCESCENERQEFFKDEARNGNI